MFGLDKLSWTSVQFSSVHILEAGPCGPLFPDPMWLVVAVYMLVLLVPTGLLMVYCNWKHDYTSVIGIFGECYLNNIQYSSLIMNSFRFSGVSIPRVPTLGYMGNNRSVFLDGRLTSFISDYIPIKECSITWTNVDLSSMESSIAFTWGIFCRKYSRYTCISHWIEIILHIKNYHHISQWMANGLTHWLLGDAVVILNKSFSNLYRFVEYFLLNCSQVNATRPHCCQPV